MNQTTKIILGIIVLALVVWGVYVLAQPKPAEGEPIRIGFIGPLTGDGAAWGEEQKNAAEIAISEINKNGGINGIPLQMVYEDGKCDGQEASTVAQKLIRDGIEILIPVCSAETLAVAPVAEENQVLVLAVWPTHPAVTDAGDYIFRNSYSDTDTGRVMAETIGASHDRVGVITELTDYPVGVRDAFLGIFSGTVIQEGYQPNSRDVRTQVSKILSQNPEAILINPNFPATGLAVLQQIRQQGFKGQLYGNFFGSSGDVLGASEAQGMIFFADPTVAENSVKRRLFEAYEEQFGGKPNFEFAVAATYDAIHILKGALEEAGENPDALRDYLYDLQNFEGALGIYGFDENGDMVGVSPAAKKIENNQIMDVK